jgi:hypothetical protein
LIQSTPSKIKNNPQITQITQIQKHTQILTLVFAAFAQPAAVTTELDVAEVVWRAANDATGQLRFPAGADAVALAQSR